MSTMTNPGWGTCCLISPYNPRRDCWKGPLWFLRRPFGKYIRMIMKARASVVRKGGLPGRGAISEGLGGAIGGDQQAKPQVQRPEG